MKFNCFPYLQIRSTNCFCFYSYNNCNIMCIRLSIKPSQALVCLCSPLAFGVEFYAGGKIFSTSAKPS